MDDVSDTMRLHTKQTENYALESLELRNTEKGNSPRHIPPSDTLLHLKSEHHAFHYLRTNWKKKMSKHSRHGTQVLISDFYELLKRGLVETRGVLYCVDELRSRPSLVRKMLSTVPDEMLSFEVLHAALAVEATLHNDGERFFSVFAKIKSRGFRYTLASYSTLLLFLKTNRATIPDADSKFKNVLKTMVRSHIAFDAVVWSYVVGMAKIDEIEGLLSHISDQGVVVQSLTLGAIYEALSYNVTLGGDLKQAVAISDRVWKKYSHLNSSETYGKVMRFYADVRQYDKVRTLYRNPGKDIAQNISLTLDYLACCEKAVGYLEGVKQEAVYNEATKAFDLQLQKGAAGLSVWFALFNVFVAGHCEERMRELIQRAHDIGPIERKKDPEHRGLHKHLLKKFAFYMKVSQK